MEITYSFSFPWGIASIKLAANCMGTASAADSTRFSLEKTIYNYFVPITRNRRQIIWKKKKQ